MSLHRDYLQTKVDQYKQMHINAYESLLPATFELPDDIQSILDLERSYNALTSDAMSKEPLPFKCDIPEHIRAQFAPAVEKFESDMKQLNVTKTQRITDMQKLRESKIADATQRASAGVQPVINKHQELMSYKDKIETICAHYHISPTDMKISEDITQEEYVALLDAAIEGCRKMVKRKEAKFNPLSLLYKPIEWDNEPVKQIVAITAFCIVFRNFGGILALAFFIGMYASTIGVYKQLDKLKIAESMMYTPDFDKFMKRDEIEAIPELDTSDIEKDFKEQREALLKDDPNEGLSKALQEYNADLEFVSETIDVTVKEVKDSYDKMFDELQKRRTSIAEKKQELIDNMKKFGDDMLEEKPVAYPSYKYVLGKLNAVIEQRVEVPNQCYTFNSKATDMISFLKLMLCNAILDIKEKKQSVIIYDPQDLGKDFAEFLGQETRIKDLISVKTDKIGDILTELRAYVTTNIRKCGQRTLDDLNKEAEEKGMITTDYKLLVIMSGAGKSFEDENNVALLENCHKYGVHVWIYNEEPLPHTHFFKSPYDLPSIKAPLPYSFELGAHVTDTFARTVENSKDGAIDYITSIQEKYIPREKWGTWSTNKGIDLNFGLADGDPSKGYPMVLGDANVHLLMAGQSGAGKSAAINQMLLSLLCKYSPNELMLVMIDFKNVEFSTFTKPDPKSTGKLSIIPHARIMAGTKDGEYALSIFDFLIAEMERRQKVFGAVNQKKLEDYNNLMTEQGHPEKRLPRILLLIDEFQVMFTEVDRAIVDKIQDRIRSLAKLARAFGCHMWFTSQSMSGTMSNDVKANFSMRAALRCTKEVSSEIIGNGAAGEIKAKFGYLITNDSTGQDPTRNTTWRVPFVSTKKILAIMNESAQMYAEQGITGYCSDFYDEDQLHADTELFQFYEDNKENPGIQNPHLLVLGKRTNFSLNNAPVNFYLEKGDQNNIVIAAMEDHDLLNITRTLMDNCQAHGTKFIISCADEDAHQLLELDERLQGPFLKWSYPSVEFKDWVNPDISPIVNLIEKRKADPTADYSPVMVILYCWDKYTGFGVAEDTRTLNTFKTILREGPVVDVHFVLIMRDKGEVTSTIYPLFKHKICALCSEAISLRIMDNTSGNKLPNQGTFAIYKRGNEVTKFKIYQHTFSRKLADKELKI